MGREWGRGGQFTSNLGPRVDEDRTTQKGGFPSKKEGLGYKGSIKGNWEGELTGGTPYA